MATSMEQTECTPARGADSGGASRFFYVAKASARRDQWGCLMAKVISSDCQTV